MLRILPATACLSLLLMTGCVSPRLARQEAVIDSLRTVNAAYQAERLALEDSLAFYEAVRSGQYARDMEALRARINRLEYLLATCRDGGAGVATLLVDDLFAPGTATLTEGGRRRLTALAETLQVRYADRSFRVEGHADSIPPGPALRAVYPSNWELSAARAAAVVRHLVEAAGIEPARFEIVAYGDTRPVARNDDPLGRRRNRRIHIAVRP
ncbi:OmpA family protein [Rhodocaloribacter litoris]|uniref:OmpA/MotB family protein n=1 Tax=Rhodocaloribacter litoris TaxID=2558931 RepID=UPI0014203219|nr:OmpA family protein [Rhodocaloribacter litoris]QXD13897.1 OmpA family protein [Rhodocaloribacter litoris]